MQSRRDHVQAYHFVTSRLASALVAGDPGRGDAPLRRSGLGLAWGLIIAVLLCGGFAVYGLINPGGATDWKLPGSIVVEKETGNRYLYLNGVLYPTLNSASAMLFFGGSNTQGVFRPVSRNSLAGVPHGRAVGIPGAPDSVPRSQDMLPARWALCTAPGTETPSMTIDLDPNTPTGAMPDNTRFLVLGQDGVDYVVWRDTIYPIGSHTAVVALGLGDVPPTAVPTAWIHALHQGQTLDTPAIPDAGKAGPTVDGLSTKIGQLFSTTVGNQTQNYVLRGDGVAPVNATALALMLDKPNAAQPRPISAATLAQLPESQDTSLLQGTPDLISAPTYHADQNAVCVRQGSSGDAVSVGHLVTERIGVVAGRTTLHVPAGKGMLATSEPPVSTDRDFFLITDLGEKFPLSQQAVGALQLGGTPVGIPRQVLAAMPSGPDLVTGMSVLTATNGGGQ